MTDIRYIANLGETYIKLNNPAKALTYFERLTSSRLRMLAMRIADCYVKLGNINKSKNTLETLIAMPVHKHLKRMHN